MFYLYPYDIITDNKEHDFTGFIVVSASVNLKCLGIEPELLSFRILSCSVSPSNVNSNKDDIFRRLPSQDTLPLQKRVIKHKLLAFDLLPH